MAQSALAYQQPARRFREQGRPVPQPQQRPTRPPLRVLPAAPRTAVAARTQNGLAPAWQVLFVCAIIAALVIGAVWIARVSLSEATMALSVSSQQVAQSIEAERSAGARLEVQYAFAANPSVIQEAATQMGMSPDPSVNYLRISTGE
ncbi:MAG: hypothetical protein LBU31_01205 [Coriobacteriales bacterium]|jgi:hypothetical protein|nr:hypothetical protein [Coriobacteriales bacterium]